MGKGTIISEIGDGRYSVQINYDRTKYNTDISNLDAKIALIDAKLIALPLEDAEQKAILRLTKLSYEKQKAYLENENTEDQTINIWCSDLSYGLTGEVGLIEVPGEDQFFNIQPGYEDNHIYNSTRDGQLVLSISQNPEQLFYNCAMLPGWQKFKPTFRYGTITAISGNTATVTLDTTKSSQQNLDINQTSTLENVEIEYMECDGGAFSENDEVLIKFTGQDWSAPKIIGFKDNPKPCASGILQIQMSYYADTRADEYIYYDMVNKCLYSLKNPSDDTELSQPLSLGDWTSAQITAIEVYNHITDSSAITTGLQGVNDFTKTETYDSCSDEGVACTSYIIPTGGWFGVDEIQTHVEYGNTLSGSKWVYESTALAEYFSVDIPLVHDSEYNTVGNYYSCESGDPVTGYGQWQYDADIDANHSCEITGRILYDAVSNDDHSCLVSIITERRIWSGTDETNEDCTGVTQDRTCDVNYEYRVEMELRSYVNGEATVLATEYVTANIDLTGDYTYDVLDFAYDYVEYDNNSSTSWKSTIDQENGCMAIAYYTTFDIDISAPSFGSGPSDTVYYDTRCCVLFCGNTQFSDEYGDNVFSLDSTKLDVLSDSDIRTLFGGINNDMWFAMSIKIYEQG